MEEIKEGIVRMFISPVDQKPEEWIQEIDAVCESIMNLEKKIGHEILKAELSRIKEGALKGKFSLEVMLKKPA